MGATLCCTFSAVYYFTMAFYAGFFQAVLLSQVFFTLAIFLWDVNLCAMATLAVVVYVPPPPPLPSSFFPTKDSFVFSVFARDVIKWRVRGKKTSSNKGITHVPSKENLARTNSSVREPVPESK